MEKSLRPLAIACMIYSFLMLALAWVAVLANADARTFMFSVIVATIALLLQTAGFVKKNVWLMVGAGLGVLLICPSPLGLWPLVVGLVLTSVFAFVAGKVNSETGKFW